MRASNRGDPNNIQLPNTIDAANSLEHSPGRPVNSDAPESTGSQLVLQQRYHQGLEVGRAEGYQEALDHLVSATGASQSQIPDSFTSAPKAPIPWSTYSYEQNIFSHSPAVHHLSTSSLQARPQLHSHVLYPGEANTDGLRHNIERTNQLNEAPAIPIPITPPSELGQGCVHFNDNECLSPGSVGYGQHDMSSHFFNNAYASGSDSVENLNLYAYAQVFQASNLRHESSAPISPGPKLCFNSKTCRECGRRFRRSSDLMGHMYMHTGIKRE
ncbi:hypothetical protein B0J17DRAFT_411726 [Rhizoctonia solani]|nr:hypothetical protein B0J17DRAFT_411726 [Rhizoctonia solani]